MKVLKNDPAAGLPSLAELLRHGISTNGHGDELDMCAAHLVWSYLAYHCCADTAAAFMRQWLGTAAGAGGLEEGASSLLQPPQLSSSEAFAQQTLEYRGHLRRLLLDGRISEALLYLDEFFPQVLQADPTAMVVDEEADSSAPSTTDGSWLRFRLLCQQFVEMVRVGDATAALEFIESVLAPLAQRQARHLAYLQDVVVLLAYADPADSPVSHLLAMQNRNDLAAELNAAILKQSESPLETVLRQMVTISATFPDHHQQSKDSSPSPPQDDHFSLLISLTAQSAM